MKSPCPTGRPPGIVDKRMRLSRAIEDSAEAVAQAAVDSALAGDSMAMALVLSRVYAPLKASSPLVQFAFDAKASFATQIEAVLQAIADGQLPVDTGNQIIASINVLAGVRNVEEFGDQMRKASQSQKRIPGGVVHAAPNPTAD
jgi:hypothetical protein